MAPIAQNQAVAMRQAKELQGTTTAGQVVSFVFANSTTVTSANAGSATALPATPAGYIECVVAGAVVKIPYYLV